jgi:hypothetical protein
MPADDLAVLADLDRLGIGAHLDRPPDGAGHDRIPVVVEADQAGLGDRGRRRMKPVEAAGIGNQARPLNATVVPHSAANTCQTVLVLNSGWVWALARAMPKVQDRGSSSQAFSSP